MQVDVIDTLDALTKLRSNWEGVYDADPEAQYFLSWDWISGWFEKLNSKWLILAAKPSADASSYVAFLPLLSRTKISNAGSFYNELSMGGGELANLRGFLCDPRFQDQGMPALANHIKGLNWASLHLDRISNSPERLRLFLDCFAEARFTTRKIKLGVLGDDTNYGIYPFVKLPADWETYLSANLGSSTRKNARQLLKKVDETGEFRITHATPDTFERDLNTLLRLWEIKWAPKSSAAAMRATLQNHRIMFRQCFKAGSLLLLVLYQGETPIGAQATLIDAKQRRLLCLMGSRDLTIKYPSPGFVLHLHSIRWAIQNGFAVYDLQLGNHKYKYDFGPEDRIIESTWVSTTNKQNLGGKLDEKSLPEVIRQVQQQYKAGKHSIAERGCRQILAIDPQNAVAGGLLRRIAAGRMARADADFNKALALHQDGKTEQAEQIYRAILKAVPKHAGANHRLGVIFLQRGQFEPAERQIAIALAVKPNVAAAHSNRAKALRSLGRLAEARESYDRALALDPVHAIALNNRGNLLKDLGRPAEALSDYDRAIALRLNHPATFKNRGDVLEALGRAQEALASYEQAIALKPDNAVAHINRGAVLHDLDRPHAPPARIEKVNAISNRGNSNRVASAVHPNLNRLHPFDDYYGIETSGYIDRAGFGEISVSAEKINDYAGVQPSIVRRTLSALPDLREYCFLDLGCGKGRAVVAASESPFRKIIGVEISGSLANLAKKNAAVVGAKYPLRAAIEIIEGNAVNVSVAGGKVVLFMYNPFGTELMEQLRENIERRLQNEIEHLFLIYHNPVEGRVFDQSPSLKRWYAAQLNCEASERAFAYPSEGATVIWQSHRNAISVPYAQANRSIVVVGPTWAKLAPL
jgi:tetratricopeptide (TPR) repeat protein